MDSINTWLTTIHETGGAYQPPPTPRIPVDYLQLPSPAASFRGRNPKRSALAEIEVPNSRYPGKRFALHTTTPYMSKSPTKRSARLAAKASLVDDDMDLDPDATPKPIRKSRVPSTMSGALPALNLTGRPNLNPSEFEGSAIDERTDTSSSVSGSKSSTRSRSPTKRMVDLQAAEKMVVTSDVDDPADLPEDIQELYKAILATSRTGRGIIPLEIQEAVINHGHVDSEEVAGYTATKASSRSKEDLVYECMVLREIRVDTKSCKRDEVSESMWNASVHAPMLKQAVLKRPGFAYHVITEARIIKELAPTNVSGELLKNKMIDTAFIMKPPLFSSRDVMKQLTKSPGPLGLSINPSEYPILRFNPVVVGIEPKAAAGDNAYGEVQLSVWAMAYFNRMRQITGTPVGITLPLILVSATSWQLLFARDLEDSMEIIDALTIGDTRDIIGCYKILASLRLLCDWAENTFLKWFKTQILGEE